MVLLLLLFGLSGLPSAPSTPVFFVRNGEDLSAAPAIRRVSDDDGV